MPALPESLTLRAGDLVLRDWRDEDEAALEPLFGDPDVDRFSLLPADYSRAAALEHLARLRSLRAAGELLALAVTGGAGPPVGNVNLVFRFGADDRQRRWATGSRPPRDAAGSRSTPHASCASGASASSRSAASSC